MCIYLAFEPTRRIRPKRQHPGSRLSRKITRCAADFWPSRLNGAMTSGDPDAGPSYYLQTAEIYTYPPLVFYLPTEYLYYLTRHVRDLRARYSPQLKNNWVNKNEKFADFTFVDGIFVNGHALDRASRFIAYRWSKFMTRGRKKFDHSFISRCVSKNLFTRYDVQNCLVLTLGCIELNFLIILYIKFDM